MLKKDIEYRLQHMVVKDDYSRGFYDALKFVLEKLENEQVSK